MLFFAIQLLVGLAACQKDEATHANRIFNQIHNSMRQFGSSLNHNGMGFFVATIPSGTEFYHGGWEDKMATGPEWLAFEPEHAMIFCSFPTMPPWLPPRDKNPLARALLQKPLQRSPPPRQQRQGYFHTYRTKQPLRLLYLDGMSAAKCQKGTLDTQDRVLLHNYPPIDFLSGDPERAKYLCDVAATEFQGRIDGVLRMEAGFEVILCDFEKNLDIVSIVTAEARKPEPDATGFELEYYQAVASRYDGIGGGRVKIHYGNFVTLYDHADAIYFDEQGLPRADNSSHDEMQEVVTLVKKMLFTEVAHDEVDWQAVTDMIVSRYGDKIEYMASSTIPDIDAFRRAATKALQPFIDYSSRNKSSEVERCTTQFLPRGTNVDTTPGRAVYRVATAICQVLSAVAEVDTLFDGQLTVKSLKDWLAWSKWKRCEPCRLDEVCFVPMWPIGDTKYHDQPSCINASTRLDGSYWFDAQHPPP